MTSYSNILTKLENDPSLGDYEQLNKFLKDENSFISTELHSAGETFEQLLRIVQRDVNTRSSKEKEKWSQAALKALGYALHNRMLSARITEEQSTEIIELICGIVTTTKNKSTCNLAVWCISVQNLSPSVLSAEELLHALLSALQHAIEGLGATDSSSVRHEGISAIARLILQCPQAIFNEQIVSLWLPLLLLHMLDPVVKVREKATSSVAMCMVQLSKLSKTVPEHISQCVFDALADKLLRAINEKMEANEDLIVVRTWGQIVGLLGRFILKSDLINTLLKIPSRTFTSSDAAVRVQSCQSWRYLIDNFALQPNSLLVVKRLKLLIAPIVNCLSTDKELAVKQEAVKTWIYLLNKLGDHVTQNYEHVIQPCLDVICKDDDVGMRWDAFAIFANLLRPAKEQSNITAIPIQGNTAVITWSSECVESLWRDWLQMFRHFALDDALYQHKAQYLQQVVTCFSYLTNHAAPESGLVSLIDLISELRDQIDSTVLHGIVQALLHISSVSWHGPGTPITALLTLCLSLARDSEHKTLFTEAVSLLFAAPSPADALRHVHALMKQWTGESDVAQLSAWQLIGQELHKFIESTHCVTTGPEEFEAMNHILLVPLLLLFAESHDPSQSSQSTANEDKSLVALWTKLCASYVRIAAVKSQHANNAIYTLANTLTTLFHSRIVASSRSCVVLTRCLTAVVQSVTMPLHTQPQMGKFWRNDPNQEAQVILLLDVVACVLSVGLQHADLFDDSDVSAVTLREVFDLFAAVQVSDTKHVVQLVQAITALFEHVSSAVDYHLLATALAPVLTALMRSYSEQASSKAPLFSAGDEWLTHFFEAAKRTHRGMYDSHLLSTLSSVLAVTLLHGKKSIKNKTVTFWCDTFGAQTRALEYPQVLHSVLAQVKNVSKIKLPGWRDDMSARTEEHVEDELPDASLGFVDFNDLQSIKGGVQRLKKSDTSNGPAVKSSAAPFKRPESRVLQESDAVNREANETNNSSNKRKRPLLTERQREALMERNSYVPVTYTAVDASQSADEVPADENEEPLKKKQKTSHSSSYQHWMQSLDALFSDESALQSMSAAQLSEVQGKLATYLGRVAFKLTIK